MRRSAAGALTAFLVIGQVLSAAPATADTQGVPPGCHVVKGDYYLQNAYGMVVEVAGAATANGSRVQIWGKRVGRNNQKWRGLSCGDAVLRYWNVAARKCLDVRDHRPARNGSTVHIWDCHRGINQNWDKYCGPKCRPELGAWVASRLSANRDDPFVLDTPDPRRNGSHLQLWRGRAAIPANSEWKHVYSPPA